MSAAAQTTMYIRSNVDVAASAWALRRNQRGHAVGFWSSPRIRLKHHHKPRPMGQQPDEFRSLCNAVTHCRKTGRVRLHSAIGQGFRRNETPLPEPSHIGHVLLSPFETRRPGYCVPTESWHCRRIPEVAKKVGSAPGFEGYWTLDLACRQTRFARIMHRSEFGYTSGDYSSGRPWRALRCSAAVDSPSQAVGPSGLSHSPPLSPLTGSGGGSGWL